MYHHVGSLQPLDLRSARCLIPLLMGIALLFLSARELLGQEIIVHGGTTGTGRASAEDGNPKYDADGTKNGVVVWKGSAIHIITSLYDVAPASSFDNIQYTLIIENGARVKIARRFDVVNGVLTWEPITSSAAAPALQAYYDFTGNTDPTGQYSGVIQMDGAVVTDIRDDEVGGDTNQDGNATSPPASGVDLRLQLQLSGSSKGFIKKCTLKYVKGISVIGNTLIANNTFVMFGQMTHVNTTATVPPFLVKASPTIQNNVFEFASYVASQSGLVIQGFTPIILGNTFRYAIGTAKPPYPSAYDPVITGGLTTYNGIVVPRYGETIISRNIFETGGGIQFLAPVNTAVNPWVSEFTKTRYEARIESNRFIAPTTVGSGGICLTLPIAAAIVVRNNVPIQNYQEPLNFDTTGQTNLQSPLLLTGNWFELCNQTRVPRWQYRNDLVSYWSKGYFINAENNYWGDPSGPLDQFSEDGLSNPRGKGLKMGNGIDYDPFIGGTRESAKDQIYIGATATPTEPLLPKSTATINVNVTSCKLASAATGKIFVTLRDEDGYPLNRQTPGVSITSQTSSLVFPAIQVQVPELSDRITVEADIVPDGNMGPTTSNVVVIRVDKPQSRFTVQLADNGNLNQAWLGTGVPRGVRIKFKLRLNYTLSTPGGGRFELSAIERHKLTGKTYNDIVYTPKSFDVVTGVGQTLDKDCEVEIPLRDVLLERPKGEIYVEIVLKEAGGTEVGKEKSSLDIDETRNRIKLRSLEPGVLNASKVFVPSGRSHFIVGELAVGRVVFEHQIVIPGVTNWQIYAESYWFDGSGGVLEAVVASVPWYDNLPTTSGHVDTALATRTTPILTGARKNRLKLRLYDPTHGVTVSVDSVTVDVREATQFAQRAVPTGSTVVSFNPIPVTINFSYNGRAGTAWVEEYAQQYQVAKKWAVEVALEKALATAAYWSLIPINRYWSVYDTLAVGSYTANVQFTYNPASDFPSMPGFREDSLAVCGLNPMSGELEVLPSTLNKTAKTVTTAYTGYFEDFVLASVKTTVTGVEQDTPPHTPTSFMLCQNYPNPFNPKTVVSFQLPVVSDARLVVYDILGREVATLLNERKMPGTYSIRFDASGLASGVYLYRLTAGDLTTVKKMLVVK